MHLTHGDVFIRMTRTKRRSPALTRGPGQSFSPLRPSRLWKAVRPEMGRGGGAVIRAWVSTSREILPRCSDIFKSRILPVSAAFLLAVTKCNLLSLCPPGSWAH